jgi:hypothetical protein
MTTPPHAGTFSNGHVVMSTIHYIEIRNTIHSGDVFQSLVSRRFQGGAFSLTDIT